MHSFFYFDNTLGHHHTIVFSCEADTILEADSMLLAAKWIVALCCKWLSAHVIKPCLNDES